VDDGGVADCVIANDGVAASVRGGVENGMVTGREGVTGGAVLEVSVNEIANSAHWLVCVRETSDGAVVAASAISSGGGQGDHHHHHARPNRCRVAYHRGHHRTLLALPVLCPCHALCRHRAPHVHSRGCRRGAPVCPSHPTRACPLSWPGASPPSFPPRRIVVHRRATLEPQ